MDELKPGPGCKAAQPHCGESLIHWPQAPKGRESNTLEPIKKRSAHQSIRHIEHSCSVFLPTKMAGKNEAVDWGLEQPTGSATGLILKMWFLAIVMTDHVTVGVVLDRLSKSIRAFKEHDMSTPVVEASRSSHIRTTGSATLLRRQG